jgi:hypothetical protein
MLNEAEAIAYVARLAVIERTPGHDKATIMVGPFTAFTLIGALQLATRHPDFSAVQADLVGSVIDQLKPLFAGTPGEMLLGLGDEPAFDVPSGCRYPDGPHDSRCGPGDHPAFR